MKTWKCWVLRLYGLLAALGLAIGLMYEQIFLIRYGKLMISEPNFGILTSETVLILFNILLLLWLINDELRRFLPKAPFDREP